MGVNKFADVSVCVCVCLLNTVLESATTYLNLSMACRIAMLLHLACSRGVFVIELIDNQVQRVCVCCANQKCTHGSSAGAHNRPFINALQRHVCFEITLHKLRCVACIYTCGTCAAHARQSK